MARSRRRRRRTRRTKVWAVVMPLAALLAAFCVLVSVQEIHGRDFGLPNFAIPSFAQIFGEVEFTPRERDLSGSSSSPLQSDYRLIVHQIDVGQSEAILIQGPEKTVLIDAGDRGRAGDLLRYLEEQGVRSIDLMIGTHPHADHIGGMDAIINAMPVAEVMMPDIPLELTPTTATYTAVLTAILENDIPFTIAVPGEVYHLGGGATLTILGPITVYNNINNLSIICRVVFGETSFLFTGDAERAAEFDLVYAGIYLRSDVLSLGHHGSRTSSTQIFLDAVAPSLALISCGLDNQHGHPHREVLERLYDMGVRVLRTDLNGNIVLTSDGHTIAIETQRLAA